MWFMWSRVSVLRWAGQSKNAWLVTASLVQPTSPLLNMILKLDEIGTSKIDRPRQTPANASRLLRGSGKQKAKEEFRSTPDGNKAAVARTDNSNSRVRLGGRARLSFGSRFIILHCLGLRNPEVEGLNLSRFNYFCHFQCTWSCKYGIEFEHILFIILVNIIIRTRMKLILFTVIQKLIFQAL